MKKLREHIDKAGIVGVILSHLCCMGAGARAGLIAPIFSGFLINRRVLLPFLVISLIASTLGTFFSYLKHKNILPFLISAISSITIIVCSFVVHSKILLYSGLVGIIGASIYNMVYVRNLEKKKKEEE